MNINNFNSKKEPMKIKSRKITYIVAMQWMAFVVAIVAFLFFVASYLGFVKYEPKFVIPNLVALYGLLIGITGLLKSSKDRLSLYYIFLSIWIFVIVNYIAFKF